MKRSVSVEKDFGYKCFDVLNGSHPWQYTVKDGYVNYRVRSLQNGKILYFNYSLAKEMGLISENHPHKMNPALENKLLEIFNIHIINEFDELTQKRIPRDQIKPHRYMATRYLQLQHPDKKGRTSGDGRGIWNGIIQFKGKTWDVSSRGTGVTCLAPGSVEAKKPLRTGAGEYGYGCGLAEIDEHISSAIQAEIMHLQGFTTERVLCVIDNLNGYGIGVRASSNLFRPAHFFSLIKQNRYDDLRNAIDYFIDRQSGNAEWKFEKIGLGKYDELEKYICKNFAEFAALLETEYVFTWVDWDGDNILANAGIIDYGSVRQFGIRHDSYRFDDIERWSTNLNQQKNKIKNVVQTFLQITDYLKTRTKKSIVKFKDHKLLNEFDKIFELKKMDRILYKIGFSKNQREHLLNHNYQLVTDFYDVYSYFERAKVSGRAKKVADGINKPALFNMRRILKELPSYFIKNLNQNKNHFKTPISDEIFFELLCTTNAKSLRIEMNSKHKKNIQLFIMLYSELLKKSGSKKTILQNLKDLNLNAQLANRSDRITGNALINIVSTICEDAKRESKFNFIQNTIENIILKQTGYPEVSVKLHRNIGSKKTPPQDLFKKIVNLVEEHQEDI